MQSENSIPKNHTKFLEMSFAAQSVLSLFPNSFFQFSPSDIFSDFCSMDAAGFLFQHYAITCTQASRLFPSPEYALCLSPLHSSFTYFGGLLQHFTPIKLLFYSYIPVVSSPAWKEEGCLSFTDSLSWDVPEPGEALHEQRRKVIGLPAVLHLPCSFFRLKATAVACSIAAPTVQCADLQPTLAIHLP